MAKGALPIILVVLFLVLAILAVWAVRDVIGMTLDSKALIGLLFSVIVALAIVYALLTGQFEQLKTPVGEFNAMKTRAVQSDHATIEASIREPEVIEKEAVSSLLPRLQSADQSVPLVLTMHLGRTGYYGREALLVYLETLMQLRNFRFVIIVRENGSFAAYIPAWAARRIVESPALGDEFVGLINRGDMNKLRQFPGIIAASLPSSASNLEALKEMKMRNLEALVVIDKDGKVRGVVEREQLLSEFVLALAA